MKIKSLARFLLVILLLTSGSTPVLARTPEQCGSVDPITPGDSVTDAAGDVFPAHIDITGINTSLSGEKLTVVFHLRDLPEFLTFNQTALGEGTMEYSWKAAIDVDNDRSTGRGGFDRLLIAYHIAFLLDKGADADTTAPIEEMMEASVWETLEDGSIQSEGYCVRIEEIRSGGSASDSAQQWPPDLRSTSSETRSSSLTCYGGSDLVISAEADTITIADVIPGITSDSRLAFSAFDARFMDEFDQIACHAPYISFVINPGHTALYDTSSTSRSDTGVGIRRIQR